MKKVEVEFGIGNVAPNSSQRVAKECDHCPWFQLPEEGRRRGWTPQPSSEELPQGMSRADALDGDNIPSHHAPDQVSQPAQGPGLP